MGILWKVYSKFFISYSKLFSRKNLNYFLNLSIDKYKIKKKENIFFIGAGGFLQDFIKSKKVNVKSLDIDPKRNPDIVCDITDMKNFKDNSVDVIFCLEVLEHVSNPFLAISEMRRVLKKDGILIGSTPFIFPMHDKPYDFFRYTKFGLKKLFEDFKCEKLTRRNSYFETIYVLILRIFSSGSLLEKIIMILLSPLLILILPIIFIMSFLIKDDSITTGYFFIFKK